ncbi:MAG: hypothetical protein GY796_01320, partial [Chloroflexi bacterium]|nr:hypothetical protein [Chloroflexota bacterium]
PGGIVAEEVMPDNPPPVWQSPIPPLPDLARTAVTPEQQRTAQLLSQSSPPLRDDVQLAAAYRGLSGLPELPVANDPLSIGQEETFNITNNDTNEVGQIDAVLLGISERAYFWFDTGSGSYRPNQNDVNTITVAFDDLYDTAVNYFGPPLIPGIDGDDHLHIVNASPLALCDVTLATTQECGLAGYFNGRDNLPRTVQPNSNERDMFVMNMDWFGTEFYLNVLGHEFRHMIEDNYDQGDIGWEVEGSATLAEDLLGRPANAQERGNRFLENPDQQLNSWTNGDKTSHYGQGYLLNRYIYDQLGPDIYRQFAQHTAPGLQAIDALAAQHNLPVNGLTLWLDWLVALAIHNHPNAPPFYQFGNVGLNTATTTPIQTLPAVQETTVSQYAADYYTLPADGSLTIEFIGSTVVPLLPVTPVSGQMMWLGQRGNSRNPRLTRTVDLSAVEKATLEYAAYVDMEHGYDFAYISISEDDGRSWTPLSAPHMLGQNHQDDPAEIALADSFYTGQTQAWVQETVDLTPYAGREIQLRFEYVTDQAVNYGGFALDNIAVPEIGFYDDAESEMGGWQVAGFVRATAAAPQNWHLQLITFGDGIPSVTNLPLDEDQTTAVNLTINQDEKQPILIVAATAPDTLQPAHYRLSVKRNP